MYKLVVFIPESHLDRVKQALFAAGAGRMSDYDCCCWSVLGEGQFRPLQGSEPYLGETGKLETVAEYRLETVCEDGLISTVVEAMKEAHPYETPAYDVIKLVDL